MVKVDESNVSVWCCPIMESVAKAREPGGKGDQTSIRWENTNSLNNVKICGRWA